jgi:hypothetical protein
MVSLMYFGPISLLTTYYQSFLRATISYSVSDNSFLIVVTTLFTTVGKTHNNSAAWGILARAHKKTTMQKPIFTFRKSIKQHGKKTYMERCLELT